RDTHPRAFQVLAEMDPQELGGEVPEFELYDLEADPDEMSNLATSPEHQMIRERLLARLKRWVSETDDPAIDLEAW
ncbi:MAG: N-sulfoglucosamine sulfohydrolase, partial [Planctomycetota bacterium]